MYSSDLRVVVLLFEGYWWRVALYEMGYLLYVTISCIVIIMYFRIAKFALLIVKIQIQHR
jgi:hypothetical protein